MSALNLYKIDSLNVNKCLEKLQNADKIRTKKILKDNKPVLNLTIYLFTKSETKDLIRWNWILNEFSLQNVLNIKKPKAVLLIKNETQPLQNNIYAITFGNSYFLIDKFCDRNFGFDFAARIEFSGVKTTTLQSPNLKRNKTINTYIDYEELTFDSGDSFAKLKIKAKLANDFNLFKPELEIGTSIRFNTDKKDLNNIVNIINYVEKILLIPEDKIINKIPLFSIIKDKELLETLNENLDRELSQSLMRGIFNSKITLPELEIIGATEVLKRNENEYQIKYKFSNTTITNLTFNEIGAFCNEFNIQELEDFKKIKIIKLMEGQSEYTENIMNIIEFTNDEKKCIFSNGKWYKYNKFYNEYLEDSINQISAIYNPKYDFNSEIYNNFLDEIYSIKKETISKSELKKQYYREFAFNSIISKYPNFEIHDREDSGIYEKMDLYEVKEKIMFAVKFGKASSSLCYAIDQSLTSLRKYRNEDTEKFQEIKKVGLWFILERSTPLPIKYDKHVNLFNLKMLMLHNRLDQWRKEVLLNGLEPIIYINYNKSTQ